MLSTATARRLARAATTSSIVPAATTSSRFATPAAAAAAQLIARRGYATPLGPPPKGFRQKPTKKWDEDDGEGSFNKLGKYFLMTEMARGMYVLLEQFFRPP